MKFHEQHIPIVRFIEMKVPVIRHFLFQIISSLFTNIEGMIIRYTETSHTKWSVIYLLVQFFILAGCYTKTIVKLSLFLPTH